MDERFTSLFVELLEVVASNIFHLSCGCPRLSDKVPVSECHNYRILHLHSWPKVWNILNLYLKQNIFLNCLALFIIIFFKE